LAGRGPALPAISRNIRAAGALFSDGQPARRPVMGKYALFWLLGVPLPILIILYFIFH
jgi:hypothetical protein